MNEKIELRNFGILMGLVLGLLGGFFSWRSKSVDLYCLMLAAVFFLMGLAKPMSLKFIYQIWMGLGSLLGWLNTRIILSILFYFILSPIGLILRLFGKQFLDLKMDGQQKSYWLSKETSKFMRENYEKQF